MKFVKRLIILFLILLFLTVGTVFVLITFYKKEMATMLTQHLKKTYGLTLKVDDVNVSFFSNWPNASVQFENIILSNDLYSEEPLLNARSVSLSLNLRKLLRKKFIINSIAIKDAKINLIKNKDGRKNFEFKKQNNSLANKSIIRFEVGTISIKNTEFSFLNKQFNKKIELTFIDDVIGIVNYEDGVDAKFVGNVFVKGLLFRPEKGAFLSNTLATLNLDARICASRKEFFIHQPSFVTIKNQQLNVAAFINLSEDKKLVLSIETKQINFGDGLSLLNYGVKKGLSNINISKPLDVKALIIAKIGVQEEPIIVANVTGINNSVTIGDSKIPYTDVDINAFIVSLDTSLLKGDADHAKVVLRKLKGKVYGFPFTGSVVISNFIKPFIEISANLYIDANKIPFKLGEEFILSGDADATFHYFGPASKLNKNEFLDAPMTLVAKVKFNKVSYRERGNPYTYLVNGNATVTNRELSFDDLSLKMNGGNVKLKGSVDNFVQFGMGYTNNFKANLIAKTDYFNLTSYVVKKVDTISTQQQTEKIKQASNQSNFEFNVSLAAKKLLIRKVEANNATIDLHYKGKLMTLNSLKVNTCDGTLSGKGTILDLHKIDAEILTENINVTKLFEQFEDFGQKAIVSGNLKGSIFLKAKIKMDLDEKMEVIGKTMIGNVQLKLKDGHLINYEPLQKISDFIFRNRDFNDIAFTEINETFLLDGFKMNIKEMEVASNVLNFYVSGLYDFRDKSNINLLVPWSNLKKRGKNYIPKSSGQSAENSKGLKLNYSGYPNKLKLSLGNK